jgi:hypothetical protein
MVRSFLKSCSHKREALPCSGFEKTDGFSQKETIRFYQSLFLQAYPHAFSARHTKADTKQTFIQLHLH